MAYSRQIVAAARAELARQAEDRQSRNAARLREAYEKVPRIREIDVALRGTMAKAAQAALVRGEDVKAALADIKEQNLALQAERSTLAAAHFPAGYLDEEPICAHCGGSGYLGSQMCRCLKALCIAEQRKGLSAVYSGGERFENFRLDYYPETGAHGTGVSPRALMQRNLDFCRRYARSFSQEAGNLLFIGGTGLGKTHLALSIGRAVAEQGFTVAYETAMGMFTKLERAKFAPSDQTIADAQELETCELLIIDDLGTEMPGQFVTAALYGILNQRLMHRLPTLITTNLNVDEAGKRYSPQIASRLYGEFTRLTFLGSDIRVQKAKG